MPFLDFSYEHKIFNWFLMFLELYFFLLFYKPIFHHINPVVLSTIIEKAFGLSLARFIIRVRFCLGLHANSIRFQVKLKKRKVFFLWH